MRWSSYDHIDCRGLEKNSSRIIKFYSGLSKDIKTKLLSMIKENQSNAEEIKNLFAYNSRCARIFARLMGECDAQVVVPYYAVAASPPVVMNDESSPKSTLANKFLIPVNFLVKHRYANNRPAAA
jgi:hypothetical protein